MESAVLVFVLVALLMLFVLYKTAVVVPQQSAFVVERLGRFHGTLNAGRTSELQVFGYVTADVRAFSASPDSGGRPCSVDLRPAHEPDHKAPSHH